MSETDFAERFNQMLTMLGISQNEFARRIGASSEFISNVANGNSKPGIEFLRKIAEVFNINLDWLVLNKTSQSGMPYIDFDTYAKTLMLVKLASLIEEKNPAAAIFAGAVLGYEGVDDFFGRKDPSPDTSTTPAQIHMLLNALTVASERGRDVAVFYNYLLGSGISPRDYQRLLEMAMNYCQSGPRLERISIADWNTVANAMMDKITMKLRLVWVPSQLRGTHRGFEVAVQSAPWSWKQCAVMDVWEKYVPPPNMSEREIVIITDMEEPSPLPQHTTFILVLTHDDGKPGAMKEAFYDWHGLDEDRARLFCHQEYGQELETMVHAAREIVGLPVAGTAH